MPQETVELARRIMDEKVLRFRAFRDPEQALLAVGNT